MKTNKRLHQFPRKHLKVCDLPPYEEPHIERFAAKRVTLQSRALGTKLMRSEQAFPNGPSKKAHRGIPFIMPSGHISGSCKLSWMCSSYQWFSTVVRSVIERIKRRTIVGTRSKYKKERHLTEIAILYTLTCDSQMLERLLNCQRKGFRALITYYINRVDDKTRFCYDQASKSALWFELRGYPRVQSTKKTVLAKYRNFSVKSFDASRAIREKMNSLSDPWIVRGYSAFTNGMNLLAV